MDLSAVSINGLLSYGFRFHILVLRFTNLPDLQDGIIFCGFIFPCPPVVLLNLIFELLQLVLIAS